MNGYSHHLQKPHQPYQSGPWWNETKSCTNSSHSQRVPFQVSNSNPSSQPSTSTYQGPRPIFLKQQWCYVDRVGGQYVVINAVDNLPMPEKPPTDLSHYSHSPPNLARYNADRRHQFTDGLPKALEKLNEYKFQQECVDLSQKWKRQRCT